MMIYLGWLSREKALGNFQRQGVLLIWTVVEQGPTVLAVGAVGGCLDNLFSLVYHFSFLSPYLEDGPI